MFKYQYLFILILSGLFACANIGPPPTGGKKDESPPVLNDKKSTKNYQTNFKKQDLTFVFDEYVELKDIFTQVIISPPLQERWKLSKKLKTVTFEFDKDEVLRNDATYTINFGEAIRDYTEGNPVPDMRFVFSTGAYIDSIEVSGTITDALTGKAVDGALLMLYDNLADSVIRTERPFYFAKTDKSGKYKIENVKADTFKVFTLKDADLNYLFNQETELIGFPDSNFIFSKNEETLPDISMFLERPKVQLVTPQNNQFGLVNLQFNQAPYDVNFTYDDIGQYTFFNTEDDSINVWYNQEDTVAWNIYLTQGTEFKDTFLVEPSSKSTFLETQKLQRANARKAAVINLNPTKEIRILFNHPIEKIDTAQISLLEDSLLNKVSPNLQINGLELATNYRWKENLEYQLQILPGGVTDIFGLQNLDTIQQKYLVAERKKFGDLNLKVVDLDSTKNYVIKLYLSDNSNLVESIPINGKIIFEKKYKTVPAGNYLVEIIKDINKNGRWDTGNYDLKTQPEPSFSKKLDELRENWELDAEVSAKQ